MDKTEAETSFKRASQLFAQGEHEEAKQILEVLVATFPNDRKVLGAIQRCDQMLAARSIQPSVTAPNKVGTQKKTALIIAVFTVVLFSGAVAPFLLQESTEDAIQEVQTPVENETPSAAPTPVSARDIQIESESAPEKPYDDADVAISVKKESLYGDYYQYVPYNLTQDPQLLVIAHGTLNDNEPAIRLAGTFIGRWTEFAEKNGFILIAPAFDRANYQSYGGYRGLFGRTVGADEFVNHIVDQFANYFPSQNGKFYLYGHSAGAQFGVRYCVRHPDRIVTAVLSAPGRFAYPNRNAPWPYGAGRLQQVISYEHPHRRNNINMQPNFEGWVAAAELPITIIVGSRDLDPQPARPGHRGTTRIDLAFSWMEDMNRLASDSGGNGNVFVEVVDGIGHDSKRLTPYCQYHLARY